MKDSRYYVNDTIYEVLRNFSKFYEDFRRFLKIL